MRTLREHDLVLNLSLPCAGEVWRIVNNQIVDHLSNHNIHVKSQPGGFFSSPMSLIHPKKGRQMSSRVFNESDLTASTFTITELEKISLLVSNPEENAEHGLLFFGKSRAVYKPLGCY